jgi:hypothetical protein
MTYAFCTVLFEGQGAPQNRTKETTVYVSLLCQILIKNTAYDYIDKPMGAHGLPWAGRSELGIGLGFGPSAHPDVGWADKKYKTHGLTFLGPAQPIRSPVQKQV